MPKLLRSVNWADLEQVREREFSEEERVKDREGDEEREGGREEERERELTALRKASNPPLLWKHFLSTTAGV
jgi:hypothetical protein